jgi:hypothetical protein
VFGSWGPANAVLSRWPISDVEMHQLPALAPAEWGGLVQRAVIKGPRRPVLVFNVALDWPPYASVARQHALGYLVDTITADPLFAKAPLVVAGDFNAAPDSDEIRALVGHRETVRPASCLTPEHGARSLGRGDVVPFEPVGSAEPAATSASTTSSPVGPAEVVSAAQQPRDWRATLHTTACCPRITTPSSPICATETPFRPPVVDYADAMPGGGDMARHGPRS